MDEGKKQGEEEERKSREPRRSCDSKHHRTFDDHLSSGAGLQAAFKILPLIFIYQGIA